MRAGKSLMMLGAILFALAAVGIFYVPRTLVEELGDGYGRAWVNPLWPLLPLLAVLGVMLIGLGLSHLALRATLVASLTLAFLAFAPVLFPPPDLAPATPAGVAAVKQEYWSQLDQEALVVTAVQVRAVHAREGEWSGDVDLYTFFYLKAWSYEPGYGLRPTLGPWWLLLVLAGLAYTSLVIALTSLGFLGARVLTRLGSRIHVRQRVNSSVTPLARCLR